MDRALIALLGLVTLIQTGMMPAAAADEPAINSPAGEIFGLQAFIDQRLATGEKRIVIPPGRYRVVPWHGHHLRLSDLQDVQIIADGVEMVCAETTRAITISRCRNVTLRGLAIDYDPLPFTQGRITGMSADKRAHEIELFDGYPGAETVLPFKYEIFRADNRTLRWGDYDHAVEKIDSRHLRVVKSRAGERDPEQVGDVIAIGSEHAPGGSIAHAVVCEECVGARLEDVDLWASNCFGFFETNCDGTTYLRCRIDRRPATGDPVKRSDARIRSLNADAFHSKHAVKGPTLSACVARFMGDDGLNICGDYHLITGFDGPELRVLANHELNIAVGEPVELLDYNGSRRPDAQVLKIEPDGSINEAEKEFLLKQKMDEQFRTRWNAKAYKVTLDRSVDLPLGSLLASTRHMGNGFLVQGCDFGFNRARGILIKASQGKVIDNKLTGNWMQAIKVAPEYWWLESGSSNHVEIRGNTIRDCRSVAIAVYAEGAQGKLAPAAAHHDVSISGNTIVDCPLPNIYVTSTSELRIEHNRCAPAPEKWANGYDFPRAKLAPVMTDHCERVVISDNTVENRPNAAEPP